jgi:hypothetical protein
MDAMHYAGTGYFTMVDTWTCGEACSAKPGVIEIVRVEHDSRDNFGYLAYHAGDNEIIVSFRGTAGIDFENWITNLEFEYSLSIQGCAKCIFPYWIH